MLYDILCIAQNKMVVVVVVVVVVAAAAEAVPPHPGETNAKSVNGNLIQVEREVTVDEGATAQQPRPVANSYGHCCGK